MDFQKARAYSSVARPVFSEALEPGLPVMGAEAGALSSRSMEAWRSSRSISLPRLIHPVVGGGVLGGDEPV